jgi:hypothetical protein
MLFSLTFKISSSFKQIVPDPFSQAYWPLYSERIMNRVSQSQEED